MEDQLLAHAEGKKSRKFRGLRKLFKRGRSKAPKDKFSALNEQAIEETTSTVNISFSDTQQSPFSPEDSFDSHFIFGGTKSAASPARSYDLYSPEFTDPALAFQDESPAIDDSFAQLDVDIIEQHRSFRGNHDSSMQTITSSEESSNLSDFGHQLVYRSRSDGSRRPSLGAIQPTVTTDEGTELVLTKSEVDVVEETEEEGIFLSFKSPKLDTNEAFNNSGQFSYGSDQVAARKRFSLEKSLEKGETIPELSPGLSTKSRLTWVSHDEDCESMDARPVKEIVFPTLAGSSLETNAKLIDEEVFFEDNNNGVEVDAHTELGSVRDAIFATFDGDGESSEITMELKRSDGGSFAVNRLSTTSSKSLGPKSRPANVVKPSSDLVNTSAESGNSAWDSSAGNVEFPKPPRTPKSPKTPGHSSAFLKRKSAFTGKDLLTVEAESFAKFLEDEKQPSALPTTRSAVAEKVSMPEDLLLFALAPSDDGSDDIAKAPSKSTLTLSTQSQSQSQSKSCTASGSCVSTTNSKSSSAAFSKAISFDTFEALSNRSNEEGSSSFAASASSAPSTIGGSMTRYEHQKDNNYCGLFPEDDDEELTVRSEDFSSSRATESGKSYRRRNPDLLDDIRLGLLETVQDLAREGSSVMMKLMKN